jgi:hypothetical protein
MIASFLHNFVFIKTRKTGGTTVEMTLAPHCGAEDIVTAIGRDEELIRGSGVPLCRNFMRDPEAEQAFRDSMTPGKEGKRGIRRAVKRETVFTNHMIAGEIKRELPEAFWNKAFRFTIERHPYERVVSKAFYRYKSNKPFEEFLDEIVRDRRYSSFKYYSIDGSVVVDDIMRTENLHEDLRRVGKRIGIPIPDQLVRAKGTQRTDRRPAHEILTQEQKDIIADVCKREFELLGYQR